MTGIVLYSNKRDSIEPTYLRCLLPIVTKRRRSSKKGKSIVFFFLRKVELVNRRTDGVGKVITFKN
jgi:hypothetical protein